MIHEFDGYVSLSSTTEPGTADLNSMERERGITEHYLKSNKRYPKKWTAQRKQSPHVAKSSVQIPWRLPGLRDT